MTDIITPPAIAPLPTPPDPNNRATFNTRAYPWSVAQGVLATQMTAALDNVRNNALAAHERAVLASLAQTQADASAAQAVASAISAASSRDEAAALVDSYQGALASNPTQNKHGGVLAAGDWYINTTSGLLIAFDGLQWVASINVTAGVSSFNGLTGDVVVSLAPVGSIIEMATNLIPTGYLIANGAAVSRTAYAALFEALGTIYGAGNGSTTFNLPDYRGVFRRGLDNGRGLDSGRSINKYQESANLAHSHTASADSTGAHAHTASIASSGAHSHVVYPRVPSSTLTGTGLARGDTTLYPNTSVESADATQGGGGAHTHSVTISSSGGHSHSISMSNNGANEARPANMATLVLIKY